MKIVFVPLWVFRVISGLDLGTRSYVGGGRAVTAQNQQSQIIVAFLVFPIGVKHCIINLCNNPCDRKMPKHFSDYVKGLFSFIFLLSFWPLQFSPSSILSPLLKSFCISSCFAMMKLCANFHDFIMSRKWGCSSK